MNQDRISSIIFDLDGTVYRGNSAIPGASDFIRKWKSSGGKCLFVTNRSKRTAEAVAAHLQSLGIAAHQDDVLTSGQATAKYLQPDTAYCIGEQGLVQPLIEAGFTLTESSAKYVVVGFDGQVTYHKIEKACHLIREGSIFVATNLDFFINTERGFSPENGAIVEAIRVASESEPLVIGKPNSPIIDQALNLLDSAKENTIIVGDNLQTDIKAGVLNGIRSVLMLTGVTKDAHDVQGIKPDWIAHSYDELAEIIS
jgi:4-nitrophenyl phosphatase